MIFLRFSLALFVVCFPHGFAKKYWSRRYHASIIVGNWIYIDGGDIAYEADTAGERWFYDRDNITYGIDLSRDWTNSTLSLIQTARPQEATALLLESLWFDDKRDSIYCYGGFRSYGTPALNSLTPPIESIWGFKQNDDGSAAWSEIVGPVSTAPWPHNIRRLASGTSVSDGNRAYYLGGFYSWETGPGLDLARVRPPGLLIFEFDTLTITNSSDGGYLAGTSPGTMINIAMYGDDGILVVLPSGSDANDYAFNNITLYDTKNQKWYSQLASGDIPEPRSSFCAVGIEGDENVSFEIFIHGGVINNVFGSQASNSDQVYILSLPSFRWFRANYTSAQSRGGHTCHATNSSQIIMIGGQDPTYCQNSLGDGDGDGEGSQAPADPWNQGIGVFDMTTLSFKDSYQAKAKTYETPDVIKEYYSINDNHYPLSWTNLAVQELFEPKSNKTSNTTNPITSNAPLSGLPSSTSRSHLSHGVVAGIAVGCSTAIVLCAAGATFIVRRKSKNTNSTVLLNHSPQMLHSQPQFMELSAEQRTQEMLTEHQDRAQLSGTDTRSPMELSSGVPTSAELHG